MCCFFPFSSGSMKASQVEVCPGFPECTTQTLQCSSRTPHRARPLCERKSLTPPELFAWINNVCWKKGHPEGSCGWRERCDILTPPSDPASASPFSASLHVTDGAAEFSSRKCKTNEHEAGGLPPERQSLLPGHHTVRDHTAALLRRATCRNDTGFNLKNRVLLCTFYQLYLVTLNEHWGMNQNLRI